MIKSAEMFTVICDNWKEDFFAGEEFSCYGDQSTALENAMQQDGAAECNGKHYCPMRVSYDSNDVLIFDSDRSKP